MKAKTKTTQKSGTKSAKKPRNAPDTIRWQLPQQPVKGNAGKILLATLSIGAVGVVGYFGWQYYRKKKDAKSENLDNELLKIHPNTNPVDTPHHTSPVDTPYISPVDTTGTKSGKTKGSTANSTGDGFPLKKGSKGDNVRQLQQALITKYGSGILPRYGADGDFGSETQNALKKKGLPTIINESTFNVITQGGGTDKSSLSSLAQKLNSAATAKNFNSVISLLKNIGGKDDYQQVSNAFMQQRLHGVRQTLVNGLLSSFSSEDQKQKIRMEFIRIGLQYDGSKWSLAGFDGKPIVTKEPATVWVNATESVQVPAMMVLGNEVTQRLDFTLFENNNKYFLVKTQSVKYL
jgi:peptidoglycan hydrolase-like protein with peptidoglycan-binding domain